MNRSVRTPRIDTRIHKRIFDAVKKGDITNVNEIIKDRGDEFVLTLQMPGSSETVLQAAIQSGQVEMLKFLLQQPAAALCLDQQMWNGDTLLHLAVKEGHPEMTRMLLTAGVRDDIKDMRGLTPLQDAYKKNKIDLMKVIIGHGDDRSRIKQICERYLSLAEKDQNSEMESALNDLVEPFDMDDPEFALYNSIITNNQLKATELFFKRVDPFAVKFGLKEMSALHAAARQPNVQVLAMLLARVDKMGRVDAKDTDGRTPLHYAAERNNLDGVDWLVFAGADPDLQDKSRRRPEDLTDSNRRIKQLFHFCYDQIPDGIILMRGDWHYDLPRQNYSFYRSELQPQDPVIPTVLMVRCVTNDIEPEVKARLEKSSFEAEELLLSAYEYRCSQPTVVGVAVSLTEDVLLPSSAFFFRCLDDANVLVSTFKLQLVDTQITSQAKEGRCEVEALKSGTLCLVRRVRHTVATATVGKQERVIEPANLEGFRLLVPGNAFLEEQKIMIQVEEPLVKHNRQEPERTSSSEASRTETLLSSPDRLVAVNEISAISCFYKIQNSRNERPNKELELQIPLDIAGDKDTEVVTAFLSNSQTESKKEQSGGVKKSDAANETTEPQWRLLEKAEVERDDRRTAVSTAIDNLGVVVAAEVARGMTREAILRVIGDVYSRNNKKEILIFAVAKAFPEDKVEVCLCAVSGELYEATLKNLQDEHNYHKLREPIVAYAEVKEVFSLVLKGNFSDMYTDKDSKPVLEYQVGGRLNYTTFVLEPKDRSKSAVGAIDVQRTGQVTTSTSSMGILALDLTTFFPPKNTRTSKPQDDEVVFEKMAVPGSRGIKVDRLVRKLSETLSVDDMKVYCHALGLTKGAMDSTLTTRGRGPLSPYQRNYLILSQTRANFRSEPAFLKSLRDTLGKHRDEEALRILNTYFQEDAHGALKPVKRRPSSSKPKTRD